MGGWAKADSKIVQLHEQVKEAEQNQGSIDSALDTIEQQQNALDAALTLYEKQLEEVNKKEASQTGKSVSDKERDQSYVLQSPLVPPKVNILVINIR